MGLFTRSKPEPTKQLPELSAEEKELNEQLGAEIQMLGMTAAIDSAVQKSFDNLHHFERDESGMFGSEFYIQSTASRFKAAYTREPWMWAAANLIARTLSSVKYVVKKEDGELVHEHEALTRLNCGNPLQGPRAIRWAANLDFILGGSYVILYNEDFTKCEHVPIERVSPEIEFNSEMGCNRIAHFTVQTECGTKNYRADAEHVLYVVYPNPYSPFYGMSLFTAAARPILLDRIKNEFELAYYLRGATLTGVIEAQEDVNKSRLKLLMKSFEALFTGKRNWHRQQILPKGLTWKQAGSSFADMKHIEGLRENRLSLLASLAVPPSKVGVTQDVNRATSEAQDKDFWENTIRPLAIFQGECLTISPIGKQYLQPGEEIVPDFSDVESLNGSLVTKGEEANAVREFWTLNEIRAEIFGLDPLPDGDKPVTQISGGQVNPFGMLSANADDEKKNSRFAQVKSAITNSQERTVAALAKAYNEVIDNYLNAKLDLAIEGLVGKLEPAVVLSSTDLSEQYIKEAGPILDQARQRGFSFSNAQSKSLSLRTGQKMPSLSFSKEDQEAIDKLRAESNERQRDILMIRAIEHFKEFDEKRTVQILDIIAAGKEEGLTNTEIATNIRESYFEAYKNQANTIVRTEILTAVSQGIKQHQNVLEQVFTEVKKQWLHVGDSGAHVRENHKGFEDLGEVELNYEYEPGLKFPRDPNASADETINCRCSMVNLVPEDAESNAQEILAR